MVVMVERGSCDIVDVPNKCFQLCNYARTTETYYSVSTYLEEIVQTALKEIKWDGVKSCGVSLCQKKKE